MKDHRPARLHPDRSPPCSRLGALLTLWICAGWGGGAAGEDSTGVDDRTQGHEEPKGTARPRGPGDRRSKIPEAARIGTEPFASAELGALWGVVRFSGKDIERFPIGAQQKSECNHHPEIEHLSDVTIVHEGRVQDAYVYIKSGFDPDDVPAAPETTITLDQRGCIYTPHVLAFRAGQKLQVANSDPTNHNVNLRAPRNSQMGNKNMGRGQAPLEFVFERRELEIRFKCDIHPWMGSVVHVQDHPWFALTDAEGKFMIPDVPPGDYVVEAIHERLGKTRGRVKVEAGQASGFALMLDG